MTRGLRVCFLISLLLTAVGVLLQLLLREEMDRTYTYQEAYLRFVKEGISLRSLQQEWLSGLPFLMIAGVALAGFTFAVAIEARTPLFAKLVRLTIIGVAVLYFGAVLLMMI